MVSARYLQEFSLPGSHVPWGSGLGNGCIHLTCRTYRECDPLPIQCTSIIAAWRERKWMLVDHARWLSPEQTLTEEYFHLPFHRPSFRFSFLLGASWYPLKPSFTCNWSLGWQAHLPPLPPSLPSPSCCRLRSESRLRGRVGEVTPNPQLYPLLTLATTAPFPSPPSFLSKPLAYSPFPRSWDCLFFIPTDPLQWNAPLSQYEFVSEMHTSLSCFI